MKKIIVITLITLTVLVVGAIAYQIYLNDSRHTGRDWDGRIIDKMDAESRMGYFASGLRFEADSTVIPAVNYPALDSMVLVMKYHECDSFLYTINVLHYHPERNEEEEQVHAQNLAESFKQYFTEAGIVPRLLTAKGTSEKAQFYVDEDEPLDPSKPYHDMYIRIELPPLKR